MLCEPQCASLHNPFLSAPRSSELFVHSCVDGLFIFFSGVFTPPFQSSREAAPVLPSLFTLLFSSIYSALQRPGAWRSKQLLHYGERGSSDCTAPPHSSLSLSLSLTAHHGCASTPLIVTIKLGLPQCQCGFRERREPGQLSETFFENRKKPNSPSSAFDEATACGKQFGGDADKRQSHPDDL